MTRHIAIFAACFLVAAVATTALRTAKHQPYASAVPALVAPDHQDERKEPAKEPAKVPADAAPTKPVNTICPICGMKVDPSIPPAQWQGRTIGFGCRMCPPRFTATPDTYGPAALKNQVVED